MRKLVAPAAIATAAVVVIAFVFLRGSSAAPSRTVAVGVAPVVRTNVSERQQVSGTLDFRGSAAVVNGPSAGVVTWLPATGSVVRRGRTLFEVDGRAVPLLYGGRPAYRDFAVGMTDGPDVHALTQNLIALGFTDGGGVTLSSHFDRATAVGVEQLQRSLGLRETGTIRLGGVVFLPGPLRVSATSVSVGSYVQPWLPVLAGTSTQRAVLIDLDPGSIAQLTVGNRVLVTLPDGSTATGRVASIGRVATAQNGGQNGGQPAPPTIPVTVILAAHASASLDQAPVQVSITTQEARNVLAVPISALLARPGGGYAVDVVSGSSTRRITVTTGLFDDIAGRVEVSGLGLAAGLRVEVPAA